MLHEHNVLIREFKAAIQHILNEDYRIVIYADRAPAGQHQRLYNVPTANEVVIILDGDMTNPRDIVLHKRDDTLVRVSELNRFYDALQYPLIFWQGNETYRFDIPLINPVTNAPTHKKVSALQYYAYTFMYRLHDPNVIFYFRELLQQLIVDVYAKMEAERLLYILRHQQLLRAEDY